MLKTFSVVKRTPVLDYGFAYSSGDILGQVQEILGAVNRSGMSSKLKSISIVDLSNQKKEIDLFFFSKPVNPVLQAAAFAGLQVQNILYTAQNSGRDGNNITIAYTAGGTQGLEAVTVIGSAISVQIESGVSTSTDIKDAIDGSPEALALVMADIDAGEELTAQTAPVAPTNLAGGVSEVYDNYPLDISDEELENCIGRVNVPAASYVTLKTGANAIVSVSNIDLSMVNKDGLTNVYVIPVVRSNPTYAASKGLIFSYGFEQ